MLIWYCGVCLKPVIEIQDNPPSRHDSPLFRAKMDGVEGQRNREIDTLAGKQKSPAVTYAECQIVSEFGELEPSVVTAKPANGDGLGLQFFYSVKGLRPGQAC